MIKVLALLVAAALSGLTVYLIAPAKLIWIIVLLVAFLIAFVILECAIFFISYIILGLFVPKGEIKKYSPYWHKIYVRTTIICMSLFGVKMHVTGMEKVPKNTTFILIHNHLSNMDPIIINTVFRKYSMTFMAKKSLSKIPFFGPIIRGVGFLFLDRDNPTKDAYQLARGIRYLKTDTCSVSIAPEGTRNFTEEVLLPFKDGSYIMAKKTNKPIVVCCFRGTENIKHNLLFKRHHVYLDVIDCINPTDYAALSEKEISDLTYKEIYEFLVNNKNA